MAENVKSLHTKKASCLEIFHHIEGFISKKNECWSLPTDIYVLLVSTEKTIILTGIYMQGVVCHSALGYGSPLSFGAGSCCHKEVHKHIQLENSYLQVLGSSRSLCTYQTSAPFCTLIHLRTSWFSLHLHFQWNWMTELNRLNFFQWKNPPIVFGRERKDRNLNCEFLQRVVVAVSSTFAPLLEVNWELYYLIPGSILFLKQELLALQATKEILLEKLGKKLRKCLSSPFLKGWYQHFRDSGDCGTFWYHCLPGRT